MKDVDIEEVIWIQYYWIDFDKEIYKLIWLTTRVLYYVLNKKNIFKEGISKAFI